MPEKKLFEALILMPTYLKEKLFIPLRDSYGYWFFSFYCRWTSIFRFTHNLKSIKKTKTLREQQQQICNQRWIHIEPKKYANWDNFETTSRFLENNREEKKLRIFAFHRHSSVWHSWSVCFLFRKHSADIISTQINIQ